MMVIFDYIYCIFILGEGVHIPRHNTESNRIYYHIYCLLFGDENRGRVKSMQGSGHCDGLMGGM